MIITWPTLPGHSLILFGDPPAPFARLAARLAGTVDLVHARRAGLGSGHTGLRAWQEASASRVGGEPARVCDGLNDPRGEDHGQNDRLARSRIKAAASPNRTYEATLCCAEEAGSGDLSDRFSKATRAKSLERLGSDGTENPRVGWFDSAPGHHPEPMLAISGRRRTRSSLDRPVGAGPAEEKQSFVDRASDLAPASPFLKPFDLGQLRRRC